MQTVVLILHAIFSELNLGISCTNSIQCLDTKAECGTGGKCSCTSNYYDSDLEDVNTAGTCVLSKHVVVKLFKTNMIYVPKHSY